MNRNMRRNMKTVKYELDALRKALKSSQDSLKKAETIKAKAIREEVSKETAAKKVEMEQLTAKLENASELKKEMLRDKNAVISDLRKQLEMNQKELHHSAKQDKQLFTQQRKREER